MDEINKLIINYFKKVISIQGIEDDSVGTILGILYMEPEEICMDTLAKKTGYSLSTISNKLNSLKYMGMIKKFRKPKSKKIYVYMEKDFIQNTKKIIMLKQNSVISLGKEELPKIINIFKSKSISTKKKKQLEILKNYYLQIIKLEKIMSKMIKLLDEK